MQWTESESFVMVTCRLWVCHWKWFRREWIVSVVAVVWWKECGYYSIHHPHHSNKHTRRAKLIGRVFISSIGYRVDFLCHNAARVFMRSLTGTVFIQQVLNQFAKRKLLFPVDHLELPLKENKPLEGGVQMGFRAILREFLLLNEYISPVQWDDGGTRARKRETASWRWSGINAWNRPGTHHRHICRRVDSEIHHGRIGRALWYTDLQTSTVQEHRHSYRSGTRAIEIRPEIGVMRSRGHFGAFTNRRNATEWTDHSNRYQS